jgi:hypothetical protein
MCECMPGSGYYVCHMEMLCSLFVIFLSNLASFVKEKRMERIVPASADDGPRRSAAACAEMRRSPRFSY